LLLGNTARTLCPCCATNHYKLNSHLPKKLFSYLTISARLTGKPPAEDKTLTLVAVTGNVVSTRPLNIHLPFALTVAVPIGRPDKSGPRKIWMSVPGEPVPDKFQSGPSVAASVPLVATVALVTVVNGTLSSDAPDEDDILILAVSVRGVATEALIFNFHFPAWLTGTVPKELPVKSGPT